MSLVFALSPGGKEKKRERIVVKKKGALRRTKGVVKEEKDNSNDAKIGLGHAFVDMSSIARQGKATRYYEGDFYQRMCPSEKRAQLVDDLMKRGRCLDLMFLSMGRGELKGLSEYVVQKK